MIRPLSFAGRTTDRARFPRTICSQDIDRDGPSGNSVRGVVCGGQQPAVSASAAPAAAIRRGPELRANRTRGIRADGRRRRRRDPPFIVRDAGAAGNVVRAEQRLLGWFRLLRLQLSGQLRAAELQLRQFRYARQYNN